MLIIKWITISITSIYKPLSDNQITTGYFLQEECPLYNGYVILLSKDKSGYRRHSGVDLTSFLPLIYKCLKANWSIMGTFLINISNIGKMYHLNNSYKTFLEKKMLTKFQVLMI
jgi:hypothetical protein